MATPQEIQNRLREIRAQSGTPPDTTPLPGGKTPLSPVAQRLMEIRKQAQTQVETPPTPEISRTQETIEDVVGTGKSLFGRLKERFSNVKDELVKSSKGQDPITTGIVSVGQMSGAVTDTTAELFTGAAKMLLSDKQEESVKSSIKNTLEASGAAEAMRKGSESYSVFKAQNPDAAKGAEAALNIANVFAEVLGFGAGKKAVEKGIEKGVDKTKEIVKKSKTLFNKPIQPLESVDDLVTKADEVLEAEKIDVLNPEKPGTGAAALKAKAQSEAPKLTIKEKWAGIRPDIKKRIEGKQEDLKSYFDVAHASNLDDTLPTIFDLANAKVSRAAQVIQEQLDDVGSRIGAVRAKVADVRIPKGSAESVVKSFNDELAKLNLTINADGAITQNALKAKAVGESEIKILQTFSDNLNLLKNNPTVENVIDNRNIFSDRINFAKSSGDVSGVIDPMSRRIRAELADINAKAVGATNASDLKMYSAIKDVQKELLSFTKKKAGSEYLLRVALSGRGREAKDAMALVKEITGIDLMDDATFLQIATEVIGNDRTKNLFRQEIGKAGLDVKQILTGGKLGAAAVLFDKAKDFAVNVEKQFLKTASKEEAAKRQKTKELFTPKKVLLNKAGAPFERAKGLTPEDLAVETKAFEKIAKEEDKILAEYASKNGKVVNTDDFRKFFKDVGYNGNNSAAVQEPASYLAKKAFTNGLKKDGDIALFYSGGSGTGKSSAVKNIDELKEIVEDATVVLDGNLSSYNSAVKKLEEARLAGKEVPIIYVYREPIDSLVNGVIKRANNNPDEMGRIVPTKIIAENHIDSWEVIKKLREKGFDDIEFVDNSLGQGKSKLVTFEEIEKKIKYPSKEELTKIFNDEVKRLNKEDKKIVSDEQLKNYIQ